MIKATQSRSHEAELAAADAKEQGLRTMMRGMKRVLVAYSGGVDSTYLAAVATQELGSNAICITGISPSVSEHQRLRSAEIAAQFNFNHKTVDTAETEKVDYRRNGPDRCYFCKDELYSVLGRVSELHGGAVILEGTNFDDLSDHRPGRIAAKNHNVISPLAAAGFTKVEIREMSRRLGLPTWDEPASPCLSSRIAPGVPVTIERLGKVERAEEHLRSLGFREFRVRVHGDLARVEIARSEMENILDRELLDEINDKLTRLGFRFVTLDLAGFRSGSLNP
jgi:uncharacterized protein